MANHNIDPDRWQVLVPYLDQALDCSDDARAAWMDRLRAERPDLADDVGQLLENHRAAARERFLEGGVAPPFGVAAGQPVGAYRLVAPIGQGGMGAVWLADRSDGRFHRRAAVKFPAAAFSAGGRARFLREGQIVARLGHPRIAQLLDAGVETSGQPYLVLEYVDGQPIDQYCDTRALAISARIQLVLEVIEGVSHAHANLIVHRDLKPSNVLVGVDGHVKLLDFGIAKLLEEEGGDGRLTRGTGRAMTPAYAAPEQMTGGPISTATDVYALGVLLYVLLTGQHPAGSALESAAALTKAIVEIDPPRPSEVAPLARRRELRGDLDTILLKALKKNPAERYASAAALAADLRAVLRHEPVSARPDSVAYRTARFVQRNRLAVGLATLILLAVVAGTGATAIEARRARAQRDFAVRELQHAEAVNDLDQSVLQDAAAAGQPLHAEDLLVRAAQIAERQHGDPVTRVDLLITIGLEYAGLDDFRKATALLEEARTAALGLSDPAPRAGAACGLAEVVASSGDLKRAEALFAEGLRALPEEPSFDLDRSFCFERGSAVADQRADGAAAVARALEGQRLLNQAPVKSEAEDLRALVVLASAYGTIGRRDEASAVLEQASSRLATLGRDDTSQGETLQNNWGVALSVLGRPFDAERALRRALAIGHDVEGQATAMEELNYARTLDDLGRSDEAQTYADHAYAQAKSTGAEVAANQALLVRSAIYRHQDHLDRAGDALAELEGWLQRNLPRGHPAFAAWASQKSLLAQTLGDEATAKRFADDAVVNANTVFESRHQGADFLSIYLLRRAQLQFLTHQLSAAESDATRALGLLATINGSALTEWTGRVYVVLGRVRQAQGRQVDAVGAFQTAVTHLRSALGPDHAETHEAEGLLAAAGGHGG